MEECGQEGYGGELHGDGDCDGGRRRRRVRRARKIEGLLYCGGIIDKVLCERSWRRFKQWAGCFTLAAPTGVKQFFHLAEPVCSHA